MRRLLSARLLILVVILLALEYTFSPFFYLLRGRIDLLYLLILDYAFFWSWERVPFFALLMGLLRDFIGGHMFGIETVSLTVTGLLLSLGTQKLERESFLIRLGLSLLFVLLTETLSLSLGSWLETSQGLSFDLMGSVFWTTIYTTALAPIFFRLTNHWFKRTSFLRQYELFR